MKILKLIISTLFLFLLFTGTSVAEPKKGFSLNGGYVSHSRECNGCAGTVSTSGASIGIDYQFPISNSLSISPFLMSSSEVSPKLSGVDVGHGIFGAQLRYWAGGMFFGGHMGAYSEALASQNSTLRGNGLGAGLVAGWENPNGGLYFMGQYDFATVKYTDLPDIKFSGLRFSVGYRWK